MRKSHLPTVLTLTILVLGALAAWGAIASFTPTAQGGTIFAVINANRSAGATTTSISVTWGSFRTTVIRGNQYGNCAGTMSGWVLMVPNTRPGSLFTLNTTGTIARPPYQGTAPPEVGHACYKLERIRAR